MLKLNTLLTITLLTFSISCLAQTHQSFSFVQICDTQLGFGAEGYEKDVANFNQAVAQINKLNPDFVVICGDLVDTPTDSSFADFKKIRDKFKVPCYYAAGNHDIGNTPNDTTLNYYRKNLGKDYYAFQHKGYAFIVANTCLWKVNIGYESQKHDDWFKETIMNNSKDHPVVVIGHHPLYTRNPEEEEGYFTIHPEKRQELLTLFHQNKVVAYLSGHTHKLITNTFKDIQLVSGESTSKNFDHRPFGYRVWQVSSGTLKQHFVPLQGLSKKAISE